MLQCSRLQCCQHAARPMLGAARPCRRLVCRVSSTQLQPSNHQQHAKLSSPLALPAASRQSFLAGDAEKESSRKFRRVTFDHEGWANHRSTARYWRHIKSMTRSRIVKGLAGPMAYVGIVATLVCCYEALLERHMLPDWGFDWPGLAVSTTGVYSLSTFALSLLLVFRTNSSYQRWNDARKLWGLTTNRSRDLARQVSQWMTDPADAERAAAACRLIKAFPVALMDSLRSDHEMKADLAVLLQPQELELILQQPHIGTAILQALGAQVAASRAKEVQKLRIDENITVLQDTMGGCERIFRTPIPLVYTRHTSRFLLCWLTILPFCTAGQIGWLTVPIACAMAFFLLGIEEIGVQVEEPFGILALEQFCENIIRNVNQAQDAAAAMHSMANTHAALAAPPAAAGDHVGSSGSSRQGSSSSGVILPLQPPAMNTAVLVAGHELPAAEQAHGIGAPVAVGPVVGAMSSATGSSSSNRDTSQLHSSAARGVFAMDSSCSSAPPSLTTSAASMSSHGSGSAPWESSEAAAELAAYLQSSVSSGALAGDSEDQPF